MARLILDTCVLIATARASNRTVATTDEGARFGGLPDVAVRLITA